MPAFVFPNGFQVIPAIVCTTAEAKAQACDNAGNFHWVDNPLTPGSADALLWDTTGFITVTNLIGNTTFRVPLYTAATLPAAGNKGRVAFTTDDNNFRFDNGTVWVVISAGGGLSNPVISSQGGTGNNWGASSGIPSVNAGVFALTAFSNGTYLKSTATGVSTQAVPIPITDGGTGSITAAAARTALSAAGLPDNNVFTARNEWKQGAAIASAATVNLGTDGNYFQITGTTTITAFGTLPQAGGIFAVEFAGVLTLTNNASIILGGGVNITTAAGMVILFVSEGAGVVRQVAPASTVTTGGGGGGSVTVFDRQFNVTFINTAAEITLYTKSIPGNTLGATGAFRLTMLGTISDSTSDLTVSNQTIVFRIKFGITTLITSFVIPTTSTDGTSGRSGMGANFPFRLVLELKNLNATNSQFAVATINTTAGRGSLTSGEALFVQTGNNANTGTNVIAPVEYVSTYRGTSSVDTTVAQTLAVTGQWATASVTSSFTMNATVVEQM